MRGGAMLARGGASLARGGATLVELMMAAPIALGALGLGLVVSLSWLARIAGAAADPLLVAVPVFEELRRDVREARAVLYPRGGDVDLAARGLVLRARDGGLVAWWAERGALVRGRLAGPLIAAPHVRLRGVERVAVRRLGGKRALVRFGVQRTGCAVVLLSAAPLAPLAPPEAPPDSGDAPEDGEDGDESAVES